MQQFSQDVKRLVSHQMKDPEVLKQMILEVAGRMRDGAGMGDEDGFELILPESAIGLEELRSDPAELREGRR